MTHRPIYKNLLFVFCFDIIIVAFSFYAAHLIRFDFQIPPTSLVFLFKIFPLVLIIKLISFYFFDLYSGMWRYTSITDIYNILVSSCASTLFIIVLVLFINRFAGISRSVFMIDWGITIFLIATFRLTVRFYYQYFDRDNIWNSVTTLFNTFFTSKNFNAINLIIIGAGDCGEKIYREIRDNQNLKYNLIGFLDDNPVKTKKKIHGIPVIGSIKSLEKITKKTAVDEILIAIPSANVTQMRRIVKFCKNSKIPFKTVPGMGELINGKVTINAIREVDYRDLLGREVITLDKDLIGAYLKNQNVLITGAGGSIGSELCKQVCAYRPSKLILYERAESPLYEIELELKQNFSDIEIVPVLADVRDRVLAEKVCMEHRPQTIFHAAAYKHVPMLEAHPWMAVDNNIVGTINKIDMAKKYKVKRFVYVSTDKAVRPTSIMGASKRVAEMLVQNQQKNGNQDLQFKIVRFGNVIGSVGSVLPIFEKQIKKGGPVTVTDPDVTRYFMTVQEACQLILQAGTMGNGGEMFLIDMGTPIKITDLAKELIILSGFEPGIDIKIEYTGLRPGEKLFEEIITDGEGIIHSDHEKIMVLKGSEHDPKLLNGNLEELFAVAAQHDTEEIKSKFKEIVKEYSPN